MYIYIWFLSSHKQNKNTQTHIILHLRLGTLPPRLRVVQGGLFVRFVLTGIGIDHRLTTSLVTAMGRYESSSMYVYSFGIYYIYIFTYLYIYMHTQFVHDFGWAMNNTNWGANLPNQSRRSVGSGRMVIVSWLSGRIHVQCRKLSCIVRFGMQIPSEPFFVGHSGWVQWFQMLCGTWQLKFMFKYIYICIYSIWELHEYGLYVEEAIVYGDWLNSDGNFDCSHNTTTCFYFLCNSIWSFSWLLENGFRPASTWVY